MAPEARARTRKSSPNAATPRSESLPVVIEAQREQRIQVAGASSGRSSALRPSASSSLLLSTSLEGCILWAGM